MKKTIIYIFAAIAVTVSCTDTITPQGGVKTELTASAESQDGLTRTSLDNGSSVLWSEGDKLGVLYRCEPAGFNDEFTLTEGAGQLKGKFEGAMTSVEAADYYAVYPFSASAEITSTAIRIPVASTQKYSAGSFSAGVNLSVARFTYEERSQLSFKNLCGILRLLLKGQAGTTVSSITLTDKAGANLWGTASISLASLDSKPEMTLSGGTADLTLTDINVALSTSEAAEFLFVVPAGVFGKGFSARVTDTAGNIYNIDTDLDNTVRRATVHTMPEITLPDPVPAVDLSASGTANCYVIESSSEGEYCFFCGAKGNAGLNPAAGNAISAASASVLWETFNTSETPQLNEIISGVHVRDGKIYFHHTGKAGNVIIAAKDAGGEILWSWHIWCVSTPLKALGPLPSGAYILDRSLGCLSDGPVRPLAYQWGRKDPFVLSVTSSTSSAYCSVRGAVKEIVTRQAEGVEEAVKNPTTFFAQSGYYNWLNATNDGLWGTSKTIYDPCPNGYKVMPSGTFTGITASDFTSTTDGFNLSHDGVNLGYFPMGTYINQNGSSLASGSAIYVWSSYAVNARATFMRLSSGTFESDRSLSTSYQSNCVLALSVRCVRE